MIRKYLQDLENRITLEIEEELLSRWKEFLDGNLDSGFFMPHRKKLSPPSIQWPRISINDAIDDFDLMALQQLSECSAALQAGSGAIMNVRANYGTGLLPSVLGAEIYIMEAEFNTLPTSKPLDGGMNAAHRLIEDSMPDIRTGFGDRCLAMGKRFVDLFAEYPKVRKYVHIYHPDLQGPMDVCELLLGSNLFFELIDNPNLVKTLLDLVTKTYIAFMHEWNRVAPLPNNGYTPHWGMLHKGRIMIRDDSAMNLSPEMFDEFIRPYDQRLLDEFKGGAIHFCGRGDHYINRLCQMEGLFAVNMSQPECNDMEMIFTHTIDKGIKLIGFPRNVAELADRKGRVLRGNVQCF